MLLYTMSPHRGYQERQKADRDTLLSNDMGTGKTTVCLLYVWLTILEPETESLAKEKGAIVTNTVVKSVNFIVYISFLLRLSRPLVLLNMSERREACDDTSDSAGLFGEIPRP